MDLVRSCSDLVRTLFGPRSEVFGPCSEVFKYCSEVLGSVQPADRLVSCHVVQWCFSAELDNMTEKTVPRNVI